MKIININPKKPEKELINQAAKILKRGGIIAIPTDTIYGIGADATNKNLIAKIYKIKKRDKNKPLIILLGKKKDALKYGYINTRAKKIISKFWPGALTIVVKAKPIIPKYIIINDTIGLRLPDNKIYLALAKKCNFPIATTSANLSGNKSPSKADEIEEGLKNKMDLIINGGKSRGTASTVVGFLEKKPKIFRQGKISLSQIKKVLK